MKIKASERSWIHLFLAFLCSGLVYFFYHHYNLLRLREVSFGLERSIWMVAGDVFFWVIVAMIGIVGLICLINFLFTPAKDFDK